MTVVRDQFARLKGTQTNFNLFRKWQTASASLVLEDSSFAQKRVPSPQEEGVYHLFVSDWLLDNYKVWDIAKVQRLFPGYLECSRAPTKLNIYFGIYVEVVSRREYDYINDMWIVKYIVLYGLAANRVFVMCRNEDGATMGRVATLFWSIWHHRNDVIWNDSPSLPNQVGRIAYSSWNDCFVVHHLKHDENHIPAPPTTDRWENPHHGWVKCNVDVAYFEVAAHTVNGGRRGMSALAGHEGSQS
ncbi:hypothetical protein TSUD_136200 [Trifolium subterraneum]|uniref:Uncharacterized protein n=1 Tax=Trifolium subterraneum TaxID=3900 RepID=A0A2Z6P165_TRISU|nr:hypothetical protein TSUD_136200 [Trifolium subterraneum]